MKPLRALAPAKINLGLFVGERRPDGRHELASVMQSISLADELTLERALARTASGLLGADEIVCPDAPELERDNLAARALAAFRSDTGWDPGPLRLQVDKRVPVAAGLGGGSGDAACALRLAAAARGVEERERPRGLEDGSARVLGAGGVEERERLLRIARELGADVPAQVAPGRWLALGAGERLQELPAPEQPFGVLVLPLPVGLSTAAAYAQADRLGAGRSAGELRERAQELREALSHGEQLPSPELLVNDLQEAAVSLCPQIEPALQQARDAGADVALLSGSGPTVIGLFAGGSGPERARRAADELAGRPPGLIAAVPVDSDFARARPVRSAGASGARDVDASGTRNAGASGTRNASASRTQQ